MKKLLLLVLSLLLAFYVGWPLWSAYRIHAALESSDAQSLESKVDFASVRESLKPYVTAEVERVFEKAGGGAAGRLLGGALAQRLTPQLVETVLTSVVTPQRIGELYRRRADIKDYLEERMSRRDGRAEGSGNQTRPADEPGDAKAADRLGAQAGAENPAIASATGDDGRQRRKLGIRSIRRIAFSGPLEVEVGIARNPQSTEADIVARLGFTGFDWKLVGLVPRPR